MKRVSNKRFSLCMVVLLLMGWIILQMMPTFAPRTGLAEAEERPIFEKYQYSVPIVTAVREDYYRIISGCFEELMETKGGFFQVYEGDLIPDAQTAMAVGNAFFQNGIKECYDAQEWVAQTVRYDSEAEVWLVNFSPDYPEDYTSGIEESVYIIMQKKDGKVIYAGGYNGVPPQN